MWIGWEIKSREIRITIVQNRTDQLASHPQIEGKFLLALERILKVLAAQVSRLLQSPYDLTHQQQ